MLHIFQHFYTQGVLHTLVYMGSYSEYIRMPHLDFFYTTCNIILGFDNGLGTSIYLPVQTQINLSLDSNLFYFYIKIKNHLKMSPLYVNAAVN